MTYVRVSVCPPTGHFVTCEPHEEEGRPASTSSSAIMVIVAVVVLVVVLVIVVVVVVVIIVLAMWPVAGPLFFVWPVAGQPLFFCVACRRPCGSRWVSEGGVSE